MAVVQHQHGGNRKHQGEVLEVPLREHGQAGDAFRGQKRKTFPLPRGGLCGGQSQVVEKGGEVRIRLIDLVPEARDAPGLDVAADQGRLPAPGRPRDPEHGRLAGLVQETVKPLPRVITGRYRGGDLRDGGSVSHFVPRNGGYKVHRVVSAHRIVASGNQGNLVSFTMSTNLPYPNFESGRFDLKDSMVVG